MARLTRVGIAHLALAVNTVEIDCATFRSACRCHLLDIAGLARLPRDRGPPSPRQLLGPVFSVGWEDWAAFHSDTALFTPNDGLLY